MLRGTICSQEWIRLPRVSITSAGSVPEEEITSATVADYHSDGAEQSKANTDLERRIMSLDIGRCVRAPVMSYRDLSRHSAPIRIRDHEWKEVSITYIVAEPSIHARVYKNYTVNRQIGYSLSLVMSRPSYRGHRQENMQIEWPNVHEQFANHFVVM